MNPVRFVGPHDHIDDIYSNNESTHVVNENEEHIGKLNKEEGLFDYVVENTVTEEWLKQIHPYLDHNSPSPKINSGLMDVY